MRALLMIFCFGSLAGFAFADEALVENMGHLQTFAHKAALAIDYRNTPLLEFYVHEWEEYLEETASIESYDGYPVGKLVESLLMPAFNQLEAAIKSGKRKVISENYDRLIDSCNACHHATQHGFITIVRSTDNPFMQSFAPPTKKP